MQDYHILLAKLESLFLTSSNFTLQSVLLYLHPTIHSLSLLYSLCLTLAYEVTEVEQDESDEDQDEDVDSSEDEEEKAIRARFGLAVPTGELDARQDDGPGPIIGGEVLGVLLEKEILRSGYVQIPTPRVAHELIFSVRQGPHRFSTVLKPAIARLSAICENASEMDNDGSVTRPLSGVHGQSRRCYRKGSTRN